MIRTLIAVFCLVLPRSYGTFLHPDNCTASPTQRGGFSIFADKPPLSPERLTLVQCGDKVPDLSFASPSASWENATYADLAALANLLFARARGYSYVFFEERSPRPSAYCRISAMLRVLSTVPAPAAALYLDSDAYVRTEQFLTASGLETRGWRRALALDEGDEAKPGVYHRLRGVPGLLSRATPMPVIQAAFERAPEFAAAMAAGRDVLNSGVWLERGGGAGAQQTLAFLHSWLNTSDSPAGRRWPFEQRTLQVLLADLPAARAQTGILEDVIYNTHASPCVPHLYAGKKRVQENLDVLASVVRARLAAAGGLVPTDVAPYVVVA
jgi:hypothetical protein